jgi:hypothetical protein
MTSNQQFWFQVLTLIMTTIFTPLIGVLVVILTKRFAEVKKDIADAKEEINANHREVNSKLTEFSTVVGNARFLEGKEQGRLEMETKQLLREAPASVPAETPVHAFAPAPE